MDVVNAATGVSRIKKFMTIAVAVVAAGVAVYNWIEVKELKKIAERCRVSRMEENEENKRLKKQRADLAASLTKCLDDSSESDEGSVRVGAVRMKLSEAMNKLTASEVEVKQRMALKDQELTNLRKEIHENYMKMNKFRKLTRSNFLTDCPEE